MCRLVPYYRVMANSEREYVPGGVLAWQDPPPITSWGHSPRTESNWQLMATQMKQYPDEWAYLGFGSHVSAQHSRIAKGKTANWRPSGSFVATTRQIDGVTHLWAKFVPNTPRDPEPEPEA